MFDIAPLKTPQQNELEAFLVSVFGEDERALAQSYIASMFSNDFRKPHFLVAMDNGCIIGAACYTQELFTIGTWGISWVSVDEGHRHKGVGAALIQTCCDDIEKHAPECTILLGTYPHKTKLYEDLGFKKSGKDHWGGDFMIKHLGGSAS